MFGTAIFGTTPYATFGEELAGGQVWADQCKASSTWGNQLTIDSGFIDKSAVVSDYTNQLVKRMNTKKCGE